MDPEDMSDSLAVALERWRTDRDWDGYWYGYFGRGVTNADFETFFVVDDSKDGSSTARRTVTIRSRPIRRAVASGLRIEVRGFQWTHVLAEDCIFWHYDIVNISDTNYDTCAFRVLYRSGRRQLSELSPANSAYYSTPA